jgi:hypothetical protein
MEYLRLTNKGSTVIVIDQDNANNSAWPYAIKYKQGSERFQHWDSRTNLLSAINEAVDKFRNLNNL